MGNGPTEPGAMAEVIVNLGVTQMAQSQVSEDDKYARSRHALSWTWVAFTMAALAAALAIGFFRIGAYQSAVDAVRSANDFKDDGGIKDGTTNGSSLIHTPTQRHCSCAAHSSKRGT